MSRGIGRRRLWTAVACAVGFIAGTLLALPLCLWLAAQLPGGVGGAHRVWMLCWVGGGLGICIGVAVSQLLTARPDDRWSIAWSALERAAYGYLIGLIGMVGLWWWLGGLLFPGCFLLFVTVICAVDGLADGMKEASQAEKKFQKEMCQKLWQLEVERAALEAAAERKFGPLDDARRARIQTWDAGRLTEARRKLETATSVEDLDA